MEHKQLVYAVNKFLIAKSSVIST